MMKNVLFLLILLSLTQGLLAQASMNMNLLANWDEDELPTQSFVQYNDIWGYVDCDGNEYAIIGSALYVHFFDLSNPNQPQEIDRFPGTTTSIWRDIKTYENRAYAAADQGLDGLMVFDMSDVPASVTQTNQVTDYFGQAHNIFVDEPNGRLYAVGTDTRSNGVIILDLSVDADNPTLLADIPLQGGYVHDIFVRGNIAYCSSANNGLWIYDFSDPLAPITLGSYTNYPESGYNHSSWLHEDGQHLVFVDETFGTSAKMVDVSDPTDIQLLDLFKSTLEAPEATNSIIHNPFIRGDYIIASYYHDGVQVFDMTDPSNVSQAAYYDTYPENTNYDNFRGCWGVYPFFPSGIIIASDISNGLFVLELEGITLAPIEYETEPTADLDMEGSQQLCEGESIIISVIDPQGTVNWYRNDELLDVSGPSIEVSSDGIYYAEVSTGKCNAISEEIEVDVTEFEPFDLPQEEIYLCSGTEISIVAPNGGDLYNWYKDGELFQSTNNNILLIETPGNYQLEMIIGDCSTLYDPLSILAADAGNIPDLGLSGVYCAGEQILLDINDFCPDLSCNVLVFFEGQLLGDVADGVTIEETGSVYLILQDNNTGCETISPTYNPTFAEIETPEIIQDGNLLSVDVNPAVYFIQWYFEGNEIAGATELNYEATESGTYSVVIVNVNINCGAESEPVEVIISSTQDAALATQVQVFPNPGTDYFFVALSENMEGDIEIFNLKGQLLQQSQTNNSITRINTAQLPDGTYLIKFINKEASIVKKWVKN